MPGDPALALGGEDADPARPRPIRHKYGLDPPLPVQYLDWTWLALQGDLGVDPRQLPVADTIARGCRSRSSSRPGLLLGVAIGICAGIFAAVRRGKASDYAATRSRSSACRCRTSGSACC